MLEMASTDKENISIGITDKTGMVPRMIKNKKVKKNERLVIVKAFFNAGTILSRNFSEYLKTVKVTIAGKNKVCNKTLSNTIILS